LVGATLFDVTVQGIVAGVNQAPSKPTIKRWIGVIQHLVPLFIPVYILGGFRPERGRILY
jgi:hypothetical protein